MDDYVFQNDAFQSYVFQMDTRPFESFNSQYLVSGLGDAINIPGITDYIVAVRHNPPTSLATTFDTQGFQVDAFQTDPIMIGGVLPLYVKNIVERTIAIVGTTKN